MGPPNRRRSENSPKRAISGTISRVQTAHCMPNEGPIAQRSEEHTSELQSRSDLVCRLLLEKKKNSTQGWLNAAFVHIHPSRLATFSDLCLTAMPARQSV